MKTIKVTETTHQWEGVAITRNPEGKLEEVSLGVLSSDKKLKETGAKELFTNILPPSTIAVEVKKNADVTITYVADMEEFKKIAKVEDVADATPTPDAEQQPAQ